jgi:hypothetical protein
MTGDSCTDEDAELHIIRAQAFLKRLRDILTQQTP